MFQSISLALVFLATTAIGIPYSEYILAPASRTLYPVSVYRVNGSVSDAESITGNNPGSAVFDGNSSVTFDYGKNIAGLVSITVGDLSDSKQVIGLTYSESNQWISNHSSDATANSGIDEIVWLTLDSKNKTYTVPVEQERGGFRYLSLLHNSAGTVEVTSVSTYFTAAPHIPDNSLRDYSGYFHCNDELLNRIWYAGAYTNQLCTINPKRGNGIPHDVSNTAMDTDIPILSWYNNYTITNGSSAIVDGAKRDRLVWPGDMTIAVPAIHVSTNDLISVKNSLDSLFVRQNMTTGQMPYAGAPFPPDVVSFTYHLHGLCGVVEYYQYTNDIDYLRSLWGQWKHAIEWSLGSIDASGLMNVTSNNDWLRINMGGHNIEANSILYYTLTKGIGLAQDLGDDSVIDLWQTTADKIKSVLNNLLWDSSVGLFRDNESSNIYPQDGNVWAIVANVVDMTRARIISSRLAERWTTYAAPAPELNGAASPFVSSFELQAHMLSGNPKRAIELMRRMWGFMLDDPRMTNSTFIEGFSASGELHYPPYSIDQRVSHAHGWATGPTSTLTFYVAGIQLLSAGGQNWRIAPSLEDLTEVKAGFTSSSGLFTVEVAKSSSSYDILFSTPGNTVGEVSTENIGCNGVLTLVNVQDPNINRTINIKADQDGSRVQVATNLTGGNYHVNIDCS